MKIWVDETIRTNVLNGSILDKSILVCQNLNKKENDTDKER